MILLNELFEKINEKMENNDKLDSFLYLVNDYNGNDWKDYVSFSEEKYKKNLVKKNDKLEMFIICWNNNQKSGIHNHPINGCIMKVLEGSLNEFECDNSGLLLNHNVLSVNDLGYKEGNKVLHSIENSNEKSVSLHIYSPPDFQINFY